MINIERLATKQIRNRVPVKTITDKMSLRNPNINKKDHFSNLF